MRQREPVEPAELHAYADGLLSPERRPAVEAYLSTHPEDAAAVSAWLAQNAALHDAFDPVLSEALPRRLAATRIDRRLAVERMSRPWALAAVAIACALAGAVAGAGAAMNWGLSPAADAVVQRQRDFLEEAASAHRVFANEPQRPVELGASDAAMLQQWFTQRLDYPVAVPDLAAIGLHLVGGRLLSGLDGAMALLLYQDGAQARVSVFATRIPGSPDSVFASRQDGSLSTVWWVDEEIGIAVTAPLPPDRVRAIATAMLDALEKMPDPRPRLSRKRT